jgi:hypothetical protein
MQVQLLPGAPIYAIAKTGSIPYTQLQRVRFRAWHQLYVGEVLSGGNENRQLWVRLPSGTIYSYENKNTENKNGEGH